jgi:hypothetical protein
MLACVLHEMESIKQHNIMVDIFCGIPAEKTEIATVTQNGKAEKKGDYRLSIRIYSNNKLL